MNQNIAEESVFKRKNQACEHILIVVWTEKNTADFQQWLRISETQHNI